MRLSRSLQRIHQNITLGHDPKLAFIDAQLATYLTANPHEHRAAVLSLYRTIVRTVKRTPPSQARDDAFVYARNEFRRHLEERDILKAHYLAQQGALEWKVVRRYFDDMREFDAKNIGEGKYVPQKLDLKKRLELVEREGPASLPGWKVRKTRARR
jgi:hypothetical protein